MDYTELVASMAEQYGIPVELAMRWVQKESGFDESAVNKRTGASGLTQVMPATATDPGYGVTPLSAELLMDPEANLDFGFQYLSAMKDKFGNWEDALRAYNAGPGSVDRSRGYAETNDYVATILGEDPISRPGGSVTGSGEYLGGVTTPSGIEALLSARKDRAREDAIMRILGGVMEGQRTEVQAPEVPLRGRLSRGDSDFNPMRRFE
jgi:hypothetical protein